MVTIESHRDDKSVEYRHEGEEFIYVMARDLELTLGGKIHVLKKRRSAFISTRISPTRSRACSTS